MIDKVYKLLSESNRCDFITDIPGVHLDRPDLWKFEFIAASEIVKEMTNLRLASVYLPSSSELWLYFIDRIDRYIEHMISDLEDLVIPVELINFTSYGVPINKLTAKSWITQKFINVLQFGQPRVQFIVPDKRNKDYLLDYLLDLHSEVLVSLKLSDFEYKEL
jgi:hypothetical protein